MENKSSMNIKALREENGLSKDELAKMLGVYSITITKWENGEVEPTEDEYKKLELVFKKSSKEIKEDDMSVKDGKITTRASVLSKFNNTRLLLTGMVWLLATVLFAALQFGYNIPNAYVCFLYAIPATCLVLILHMMLTGIKIGSGKVITTMSILVWSLALSLFINFLSIPNMWIVFVAALPLQLIVIAFVKLKK